MFTESRKFTIAVGNPITGVYEFLTLAMPKEWKIIIMPMNSDVFSTVKQGDVKWVLEGEVEHGLKTPFGNIALYIKIKKGYNEPSRIKQFRNANKQFNTYFADHNAKAYVYSKRMGFKKLRVLGVHSYCGFTNRTIFIEFIGGEEWVDEVINHLKDSECHEKEHWQR